MLLLCIRSRIRSSKAAVLKLEATTPEWVMKPILGCNDALNISNGFFNQFEITINS